MNYKPRVFVSCIFKMEKDSPQKRIKDELIKRIEEADFEPQIFLEAGLVDDKPWSFNAVYDILQKCQGVVILGLSRWINETNPLLPARMPTEYNHYEGALAVALKLPTLVLLEEGIAARGIFYNGAGPIFTGIPYGADTSWFDTDVYFKPRFNKWKKDVLGRYQVFLGYSGAAKDTATSIISFLTGRLNVRVKEYATSFMKGGSILEEIETAAQTCQCAIFLFTADDPLAGDETIASPRDNVIFEAGYFMKAKGKEKVLIIREEGAKMPADIGGNIYLPLKNRKDITTIESGIQYFLETRL